MIRYENRCCDCAVPGYPCLGSACPNRNVEVHYCDNPKCRCELEDIYEDGFEELCEECYSERYPDEGVTERRFGNILDIMLSKGRRRVIEHEQEAV